MRRIFTLEEAGEALEQVRPLAEEIVECRRTLDELQEQRQHLLAPVPGNGGGIDPAAAAALHRRIDEQSRRIAHCVARIHELGAFVKGLDEGLVDFPARGPRRRRAPLLEGRRAGDRVLARARGRLLGPATAPLRLRTAALPVEDRRR